MGDYNAKVGKAKDGGTVGLFCLGERNDDGEKLVEWCQENEFQTSSEKPVHLKKSRWLLELDQLHPD